MAAEPRAEGGLILSAEVAVDGQSVDVAAVRPVARSGIYAFAVRPGLITLTLAPLALGDAGRALLDAPGGIRVPASDAAEFVRDHLPRLARRIDVLPRGGLELPAAGAPVLVVGIAFRPEHTIDVRLEWEYAGLDRVPWDADADADRDEAAEADLRARAEVAWRESGTSSPLEPRTLRGIESAEFIAHTVPALEALDGVRVERTGTPRRYTELTGTPEITVSTVESTDPDWFDLGVIVTIDGRRIPFGPLFTALSRRRTQAAAGGRAVLLARASRARPAAGAARRGRRPCPSGRPRRASAATRSTCGPTSKILPIRPSPPCRGGATARGSARRGAHRADAGARRDSRPT